MAPPLRNQLFAALAAQRMVQPAAARPPVAPSPLLVPAAPAAARPTGGIAWGGQYFRSPAELVQWMNARGAGTTAQQFLGNHPGVAAAYGSRQPAAVTPIQRNLAQPKRRAYSY